MTPSGKGNQQKYVHQVQCHEPCIDHNPYNFLGLSHAHFF